MTNPQPKRTRMKLIPNWRRSWRMATVQLAAVFTGWGLLPPATQEAVLAAIGVPANRVPAVLGLLIILARVVDQPGTKG